MISESVQTIDGVRTTETSVPKILEQLVGQAERAGASDIHLQMRGKAAEVGFRLDGIITPGCELPAGIAERVFGRIKFLARLDAGLHVLMLNTDGMGYLLTEAN